MPTLDDLLTGVLLPAAAAAVLLLVAHLTGRRAAGAALALGGAYVAAHLAVRGWRGWVPRESTDWIVACAAGATLVGLLALTRAPPPWLGVLLRLLLALLAAWLVAGRVLARRESAAAALGDLALPTVAASLVWSVLEARRGAGGSSAGASASASASALSPLLLMVAAGCAALAIGLSGSQLLARFAGALAAALGGAVVVTRLRLAPALLPGAAAPFAVTLFALLLAAVAHARLPATSAVLLAAACALPPLLAGTVSSGAAVGADAGTRAGGSSAARLPRGAILAFALAALLGGAAIGVAWQASPPLDF